MINNAWTISEKIRLLRIGNALMFLFYYIFVLFPDFNNIFGKDSGVDPDLFVNYLKSPLFLFWDHTFLIYGILFIATLSSILFGFQNKYLRMIQIVLFVCNLLLHLANPFILHEAQYLNNVLLFSLFFVSLNDNRKEDNVVLSVLLVFLGVYYFLAAIKKLPDSHWIEGTAVGLIANFEALTKGSFLSNIIKNIYINNIITYSTLAFEFSFFLLSFSRFKTYLIVIGIMFHLGIFFTIDVGLLSFTMISFYPLLLKTKEEIDVDL